MRYLWSSLGTSLRQGWYLAVVGISTFFGCSVIVDADRPQCSSDSDCADRGAAFAGCLCINALCERDPKWSCVDSASEPPPQPAGISAALEVHSLLTGEPIAGVRATLFTQFDFQLTQPLGSGDTGPDGRVILTPPAGFVGFVFLEAPDVIEPMLYYPNLPVNATEGFGMAMAGVAGQSVGLIAMLNATPIPDRGLAIVRILDCEGHGATGGTIALQGDLEGSKAFYTIGGVASAAATVLDETGNAGVVNLREGLLGVEAIVDGKSVSKANVLIRKGSSTSVTLLAGRTAHQWN